MAGFTERQALLEAIRWQCEASSTALLKDFSEMIAVDLAANRGRGERPKDPHAPKSKPIKEPAF